MEGERGALREEKRRCAHCVAGGGGRAEEIAGREGSGFRAGASPSPHLCLVGQPLRILGRALEHLEVELPVRHLAQVGIHILIQVHTTQHQPVLKGGGHGAEMEGHMSRCSVSLRQTSDTLPQPPS